jgi:hypothetical protein
LAVKTENFVDDFFGEQDTLSGGQVAARLG